MQSHTQPDFLILLVIGYCSNTCSNYVIG